MKYKALMFDIDGTLFPVRAGKDGMPSQKVTEAINKASKKIHVGVATSRPIFIAEHIVRYLNLSGPSIIHGGALITDIIKKKIYYRQPIEREDIFLVYKILKKFGLPFLIDLKDKAIRMKGILPDEDILGMYTPEVEPTEAGRVRKAIDRIPTISTHLTPSWKIGKICISISHARATKQHAIFEVAKILGITTHEIIGVGDGGNDLPLLMGCGLRIAMGNAVEDLKEIADYIALSVEEDGVADVIEKFVLKSVH